MPEQKYVEKDDPQSNHSIIQKWLSGISLET
jgi:hypothetical protein